MNKNLYKLVFCKRLGCLVAVSEFTKAYGGSYAGATSPSEGILRKTGARLSRLALLTGALLGTLPGLVTAATLPTNGQIINGQGSISSDGTGMTIQQQTGRLGINWDSFDIAKGHSVLFVQPDASSIALNRVVGNTPSEILGSLQANGQVFLLNPNGVLFGQGAQVNVGGLVASTLSMSDKNFMEGRYVLEGNGSQGEVVNQGNLRSTADGYIALLGRRVSNSGEIRTPGGRTALAAGDTVSLSINKSQLVGVVVNTATINALVSNSGLIRAEGGAIQLTARGKNMLMDTVVNNTGILQAQTMGSRQGRIVLDGGNEGVVNQAGFLDARGLRMGEKAGGVVIEGQNILMSRGSSIDARGNAGGGSVHVGGGWQGKDPAIKHASAVVMEKGASIDASATGSGNGGEVVLWSDDYTAFHGTIAARGGLLGGNGGNIETSSKNNLQAFGEADASAPKGKGGLWLLDPTDVTIVGTGADANVTTSITNGTVFTPSGNGSQILNSSIESKLNTGTNVKITTVGSPDTAGQLGNITQNASISKTAGADATLTMEAAGNININANITSTAGKLGVDLQSGNNSTISVTNSTVSLNGGDFSAKGQVGSSNRVSISGSNITAGNITVSGMNGDANSTGTSLGVGVINTTMNATGNISLTGSGNVNGGGGKLGLG